MIFSNSEESTNRRRPIIKRLLGITIVLVVIGFLGIKAIKGIQELAESQVHLTPIYLLLSLACQVSGVMLAAALWNKIVHRFDIQTGFWFNLQAFCISALGRKIPGFVWYAVTRVMIYNFVHESKLKVTIGLIVESVTLALGGLVTLTICFLAGFQLKIFENKSILMYMVVISVIILTTYIGPKLIQWVTKKIKPGDEDRTLDVSPISIWDVLQLIIFEAFVIVFAAGVGFYLLKSIDSNQSVSFLSILGPLSVAVMLGPFAVWLPGDIGLKDGILYLILNPLIGSGLAALFILAWRIWVSAMELTSGLVSGLALNHRLHFFNGIKEMTIRNLRK